MLDVYTLLSLCLLGLTTSLFQLKGHDASIVVNANKKFSSILIPMILTTLNG